MLVSSSPEHSGETRLEGAGPTSGNEGWVPLCPGHTSPRSPDTVRGSKELVPREGTLKGFMH